MKFSKKIMITLFMCFFISGAVFTIVSSTVLKVDIDNAVQEIKSIVLYNEGEEGTLWGELKEEYGKLKITGSGSNFIINSDNIIDNGESSSILGGIDNVINGGKYSTVFGGSGNYIQSDYSIVLGGEGNSVYSKSTGSVIAGGRNNTINSLDTNSENSVVIGNDNEMNGSYSSVVGNNSAIGDESYTNTDNSVAMGSGAKVVGNNSFLRVDGSDNVELFNDDVFAIFSENGMSVNEPNPNIKAKFNVGGYFVISEGDLNNDIQCGSGYGTGIIKVEDRDDDPDQKCFCSCDGMGWKSMIGDGQCESICKGEKSDIFPECVPGGIKIVQSGDKRVYSGECIGGSVIEGSYFMDGDIIWWQCQGKNGNTTGCSYKSECTGYIPGWEEGGVKINNNIVPSISFDQREYKYSDDELEVCTYSCKTGYAFNNYYNKCSKVCDEANKGCKFGQYKNLNQATYTNEYEYGCEYNEKLYKCEVNCNNGQIWNGSECVGVENVCGLGKYECLLGSVGNTGMDLENYTWQCLDSDDHLIGNSCSKRKEVERKIVYWSSSRDSDRKQNVYFYMTGNDIPVDIKIKHNYTEGGVDYEAFYTIYANQKNSSKKVFSSSSILSVPVWVESRDYSIMDNGESIYVPVDDKLFILKMEKYNGLCVNSCSTAGQCLRGSSSNFHTGMNGNKANFRWQCVYGGVTENCVSECDVDAGQCGNTSVSNSVSCDPSSDSDCKIKGLSNINFTNFYMDSEDEKIVGSECGLKRHCIFSGGYISCNESIKNCVQVGFKCKDGYVLNGCSCVSVSSICLTNRNPGGCATGMTATGYSKGEGKNNYSYYCEKEGMDKVFCEANCGSGQIWNGSKCINLPNLCGEKHNNCVNQATLSSNQKDDFEKKYKWNCKLGNNIQNCSECYSGYVMSGNECKVKPSIDCEDTVYKGYKVPYMLNGSEKNLEKNTRESVCKLQVKCETGVIKSYSIETCRNVCNTGTNLGTCITGFSNSTILVKRYNGNLGESGYSYLCQNSYGYTFDSCHGKCPSGEYWNGWKCGEMNEDLCSESHYDCINGGSLVQSSVLVSVEAHNGYNTKKYEWDCKLGDYKKGCSEITEEMHNCEGGTYSGYYIKNGMNHLQELSVTKTVNGVKCKATAVCGSGVVTIKDEDCTRACPSGVLDEPKCNFDGVIPSYYQSATWMSGYSYKCGSSQCSAYCSDGKIWNGSKCVSHYPPYCSSTPLTCVFGIVRQVGIGSWGATWNCINVNNEKLNENICYKCNDGYVWKSNEDICEEKSCGAMSRSGYNIQALSGGSSVLIERNITNGSCKVTASCSKGNLSITPENCECDGGYYLDDGVCYPICNSRSDIPCNGEYTSRGATRGNGYTTWGHGYECVKNPNSSVKGESISQCNCGNTRRWNGSECVGLSGSLCGETVDTCNSSQFLGGSGGINWGNWWKCGVEGKTPEVCDKCKDGYVWDNLSESCKKDIKTCGGTEPQWENILKGPSTYIGSLNLERSYTDNSNTELNSCQWRCASGYVRVNGNNGRIMCVKDYNCDLDSDGVVDVHDIQLIEEKCDPLNGCANCPIEGYSCSINDYSSVILLCTQNITG